MKFSPERRLFLMNTSALALASLFPTLGRAQDIEHAHETMPFSAFRSRIRHNVLNDKHELSYEHTTPDTTGNVRILGMKSGGSGANNAESIQRSVDYLQHHPDTLAVIAGHTHPRKLMSFLMLRSKDEPESIPPSTGDAGTFLLEEYEARAKGVDPRKLVHAVHDTYGDWISTLVSVSNIAEMADTYQLPRELFSRNRQEVSAARAASRQEETDTLQRLLSTATKRLADHSFTSSYSGDPLVKRWLTSPSAETRGNNFIFSNLRAYMYNRGVHSYTFEPHPYTDQGSTKAATLLCEALFTRDELDSYLHALRKNHFIGLQYEFLRSPEFVGSQVREGWRTLLKSKYDVPDDEMDFALAAMKYRYDRIRKRGALNDSTPLDVAKGSADVREANSHWPEAAIQLDMKQTSREYLHYRVLMMRMFGQNIEYITHEEYDSLMQDPASIENLVTGR